MADRVDSLITEEWLRSLDFRWEQLDRQPSKHWLLWLADACIDPVEPNGRLFACNNDLGIELSADREGSWNCWLRADYAGRYSRLVHVRRMTHQHEVTALIEALTGRPFVPTDAMYGSLRSPEQAARLRSDEERLDKRLAKEWGKRVERECGLDSDKLEVVRP